MGLFIRINILGTTTFTVDLQSLVKESVGDALARFEEKLLLSIGTEMDSAVSRGNVVISADLSEIHTTRSSVESLVDCQTNLKDTVGELAALLNNLSQKVATSAGNSAIDMSPILTLVRGIKAKMDEESVFVRGRLSAILELLKHTLQVLRII